MKAVDSISIVIPAYNEENGITEVINDVANVAGQICNNFEIIVVDDCSTDNTANAVEKLDIVYIRHSENRGYGASLKTGIRRARYDILLIIDADGSYPANAIKLLSPLINENDMVVGARVGDNAHIPLIRRPAKRVLNIFANYLSGYKIPDLNSGLRMIKMELVREFLRILPNGFSFTTTITIAAHTNGYSVAYIPIEYLKRKGKSKIRPIYDTLNFLTLIITTSLAFAPLRVFIPFSMLFFIPGIGFIVRDLINSNLAQASLLLILTGVQILAIGFLAHMISSLVGKDRD